MAYKRCPICGGRMFRRVGPDGKIDLRCENYPRCKMIKKETK